MKQEGSRHFAIAALQERFTVDQLDAIRAALGFLYSVTRHPSTLADMRLVNVACNTKELRKRLCRECGMPMTNCCCG